MFTNNKTSRSWQYQNESFDAIVAAAETANRANDSIDSTSIIVVDGSFSKVRPMVNIEESPSTSTSPTKKRKRALSPIVASSKSVKITNEAKSPFLPLRTSTPRPAPNDLVGERITSTITEMQQDNSVWFRQFKDLFLQSSVELRESMQYYKDRFTQHLEDIQLRQERLDKQRMVVTSKLKEVDQTLKSYGDFLENFPEKMEFFKNWGNMSMELEATLESINDV